MKKWKTAEFKALKDEWYARLKQEGFQDIERERGEEVYLKEWASHAYRAGKSHSETAEEKAQYFQLLSLHVECERGFADDSDRLIMEKTSLGWTIAEISAELQRLGWIKFNRDTIRYIRRRYESKWGIRIWEQHQMVSRRVTK